MPHRFTTRWPAIGPFQLAPCPPNARLRHLDYLCRQFGDHYHSERPHQSLDNEPILPVTPPLENSQPRSVKCKTRLGGLLKSYSRQAA